MADRIIELRWKCSECGKINLGRHKNCPDGCGSPREKGEMLSMSGLGASDYNAQGYNKASSVTDPALLDLAHAGHDWFCSHCGAGQRGDNDACSACGGPRYNKAAEQLHPEKWDWRISEHHSAADLHEALDNPEAIPTKTQKLPRIPRPSRGTTRSHDTLDSTSTVTGLAALVAVIPTILGVLAGVGILILIVMFLVWAFQTHETQGRIQAMAWKQNTILQRWTDTSMREWRHKTSERSEIPPVGGQGERSGKEIIPGTCRMEHWDDEKYQCGTTQKCTPKTKRVPNGETCRSTDNGFAKCTTKYKTVPDGETCKDVPKYCTREIRKDRCDYRVQVWKTVRTAEGYGAGTDTRWPQVEVGLRDRLRFTALYKVEVAYTNNSKSQVHEFNPAPQTLLGSLQVYEMDVHDAVEAEQAYRQWSVGEVVTLNVDNLGFVHDVKHGGGPTKSRGK